MCNVNLILHFLLELGVVSTHGIAVIVCINFSRLYWKFLWNWTEICENVNLTFWKSNSNRKTYNLIYPKINCTNVRKFHGRNNTKQVFEMSYTNGRSGVQKYTQRLGRHCTAFNLFALHSQTHAFCLLFYKVEKFSTSKTILLDRKIDFQIT